MRHDTQRFHPGKGSRLQAKTAAVRGGTGRSEAACSLQDGHDKLRQCPARADR